MTKIPNNDSVLRSVGAALHNWSLVELQLSSLFATISNTMEQSRAHALFAAILSFDARLAVCDRLMRFETLSELDREMWVKMSARISKYYKKRHELAHFTLDYTTNVARISPFYTQDKFISETERYLTEDEIRSRSNKFVEIHMAVGWFNTQAFLRRQSGARKLPPEPSPEEPILVPRLRELATLSLEERKQRRQSTPE
jgi:hypothetical protein